MSSAGVGPLCFLKSTVNAAIYQELLEHLMLPSADKLYGDADFIFQQDLAPTHTAKGTKSWFNDHGVTVLDWPANSPDLNPIENLWGIVKRKMKELIKCKTVTWMQCKSLWIKASAKCINVNVRWETPDPTMQMSWRPLSKKPGPPYHLSSATNWSPPCHAELRQ